MGYAIFVEFFSDLHRFEDPHRSSVFTNRTYQSGNTTVLHGIDQSKGTITETHATFTDVDSGIRAVFNCFRKCFEKAIFSERLEHRRGGVSFCRRELTGRPIFVGTFFISISYTF